MRGRRHRTPIDSTGRTSPRYRRPGPGISTSDSCATGRDPRSSRTCRPRGWRRTDPSAAGPWPAHTPGRATVSRLPRTSGQATASMRPSPIMPMRMQSSTTDFATLQRTARDGQVKVEAGLCGPPRSGFGVSPAGRGAQVIDSALRAPGKPVAATSGRLAAGSSRTGDARELGAE